MKTSAPDSTAPIAEDDLHAFVDGRLDGARHAAVTAWLQAQPAAAARVAAWQAQRTQLRAALAPLAHAPVPPQWNVRRMAEAMRQPRPQRAARLAASVLLCVLLLTLGAAGGWQLAGQRAAPGGLQALAQEAIASYRVYAPDSLRPVELRAEHSAQLAAWARERTGQHMPIPQLAASGYRLMGGRVVAGADGAALLLMYDDDRGTRLVLLARPVHAAPERSTHSANNADTPMRPVAAGALNGFMWADHGMGYSLVAAADAHTLHPLANAIRRQIRDSG